MRLTIFADWQDRVWHRWLKRPYVLARPVDAGQGSLVVMLHGIGQTGQVWRHVIELLVPLGHRVVAFDLLGFGKSPKPDWIDYKVDDHAAAVIASLERLRVKLDQPIVLVGHSMGCLVAVRVARLRPDLVKHLVLYEMPLYEGLPEKRIYRLRTNWYFKIYKFIARYQPSFDAAEIRLVERLARRIVGFEVSADTWQPFVKSLENTIMNQTAADDIKQTRIPMDVIYGRFDMLVIKGQPQAFFGETADHVKAYKVRASHIISRRASALIVERIEAAI